MPLLTSDMGVNPMFEPLLFPEFCENTIVPERKLLKRWGPIEGEQEGESRPFRGRKGQVFPACKPRKGHFGSVEAKG